MKKNYKTIGTILIGIIIFLFFIISYFTGGKSKLNKNNNESIFVEENESMEVISKKEEKESTKIVVDIKGEVKKPDIYWLEEDSIIEDLINIAGGVTEEGDLSKINRAEKLNNHEVVVIPNINDEESEGETIISSTINNNKDNKINISKKYATKVLSSDIVRSTIFDNAVYTFNGGEYVNSFSLEN